MGPVPVREAKMNCPNCGVYNPEERKVCWRCDEELPKPKEPKKRRQAMSAGRMWLIVAIVLVVWLFLSLIVLPMLFNTPAAP
jgi:predicted nucleic acid-binding Zn ribbon protein